MSEKLLLAAIITLFFHLWMNLSPAVTPTPANVQGKQTSQVLAGYGD